jgi:peptide/nickel transport system permease protein
MRLSTASITSSTRGFVVAEFSVDAAIAASGTDRRPWTVGRWPSAAAGLALVTSGAVMTAVALERSRSGSAKLVVVFAGLASAYVGIRRLVRWVSPGADVGFVLSIGWLGSLAMLALLADVLPLEEHADTLKTIAVPGNARPDLLSRHPLGTNNFGLDVFARLVHGARISMLTATLALAVSVLLGGALGVTSGLLRGRFDAAVGIGTDAVLAFPPLLLLIAAAAVFGAADTPEEAIVKTGLALAIVGVPSMTRLVRANTLTIARAEYVLVARSLGATRRRIALREIVPNLVPRMTSYVCVSMAALVVAEGTLSFLGLGLRQPEPTWGNMLAEGGIKAIEESPHLVAAPGVALFLTVLSLNRIGETLVQRGSKQR